MFHRAWTLNRIASVIEGDDDKKNRLQNIAGNHAKMGYEIMFDSGYGGEHWLATFAIYLLTYGS